MDAAFKASWHASTALSADDMRASLRAAYAVERDALRAQVEALAARPGLPSEPSEAATYAAREITANCEHTNNIDGEFDTFVCEACVRASLVAAYAAERAAAEGAQP